MPDITNPGPVERVYASATGGVGILGRYGLRQERELTDQLIGQVRTDEDMKGLDSFLDLGQTKMTREQHSAYRAGLAERASSLAVANEGASLLGQQLRHITPQSDSDIEQLGVFNTRLDLAESFAASADPTVRASGMAQLAQLGGEIQDFSATNEAQGIARAAVSRHADELAFSRRQKVVTDSRGLNEALYNELNGLQEAMDAIKDIGAITEIDSPATIIAAAYKTVELLQGPGGGIISEGDLRAVQGGLGSWAEQLQQTFGKGLGGEGFTPEVRDNLLAVLTPLAQTASRYAAEKIARYDLVADGEGYDKSIVFAGVDPSLYDVPDYVPSERPEPPRRAEGINVIDPSAAPRSTAEEVGHSLRVGSAQATQSAIEFGRGVLGIRPEQERRALDFIGSLPERYQQLRNTDEYE